MLAHLRYLRYVLLHKYYVFLGCLRLRVPLWQAVIHDWSKFLPDEWIPYARYFYGDYPKFDEDDPDKWSRRGYYGWLDIDIKRHFDTAWRKHLQRQPHHWQYWLLHEDSGDVIAQKMPEKYVREMVADWYGAGMAQGKPDIASWYEEHKRYQHIHPETRQRIEDLLVELED